MVDAMMREEMFDYQLMHDETLIMSEACDFLFLCFLTCLVEQFRYPLSFVKDSYSYPYTQL